MNEPAAERAAERERLMLATLRHVAFDGWTRTALGHGANHGVTFVAQRRRPVVRVGVGDGDGALRDLRGLDRPSDIIVKNRYRQIWAFDDKLNELWTREFETRRGPEGVS